MTETQEQGREPIFNLPMPVMVLVGTLFAIHVGQTYLLDARSQYDLAYWFAFIPARFTFAAELPGGYWPLAWTPVTHAFLHASWTHLIMNSVWLAIFGTPVARRYGATRFVIAFIVTSAAGAFAFALFHSQSGAYLVGASGGIAGLTGIAVRFIFQPLVLGIDPDSGEPVPIGRKLATIREVFANSRARGLTLVWLVLNALTPLLPMMAGIDAEIAWQAHIGGFLAGFFMAPLLETRRRR